MSALPPKADISWRPCPLSANSGHRIGDLGTGTGLYLTLNPLQVRLPTPASPDQPHDHEQQYGADGGSNDRGNNASTKMNTDLGK